MNAPLFSCLHFCFPAPGVPPGALDLSVAYHAFYYTRRGFSVNAENRQTFCPFPVPFVALCMFMQLFYYLCKFYAVLLHIFLHILKAVSSVPPGRCQGFSTDSQNAEEPRQMPELFGSFHSVVPYLQSTACVCSAVTIRTGAGFSLPVRSASHQVDRPSQPNLYAVCGVRPTQEKPSCLRCRAACRVRR